MKATIFESFHIAMGAKMVPFAGFHMPVEFSGLIKEHLAVRNSVGIFDVSHMGEIWVKGPNALGLLQYITTNDLNLLTPGKAQYSCFPNGKGGIVDDLLVYKYDEEKYLLVVNASNIEKDFNWITSCNLEFGAELENASDRISQLAVQGPNALATLQKLTDVNLKSIAYYHFVTGSFAGAGQVIISNTGYTGAGGFELYFYNSDGIKIYNEILEAGKEFGILPIGLGARDTLRLEMGYSLYGNDIDDSTSPLEAGLGWITKFTKGFIDRPLFEKQKNEGVQRQLVGFELIDRGIPRHGYPICDSAGSEVGVVTSGTQSPFLNKGIGMGYVTTANAGIGTELFISVRNKMLKAQVVKMPFLV